MEMSTLFSNEVLVEPGFWNKINRQEFIIHDSKILDYMTKNLGVVMTRCPAFVEP
jgi:hypothetical protein